MTNEVNEPKKRGRKPNAPKEGEHEKIVFYLDRENYAIEMRKYSLLLDFAKDIKGAFEEMGVPLTQNLLIGFMQVKERATGEQSQLSFEGAQTEECPDVPQLKMLELKATATAETEIQKYIENVVKTYPTALCKKYAEEIGAQIANLRAKCANIRNKWEQGKISFVGANLEAIEYNTETQEISLCASFADAIRDRFVIKAETARTANNYRTLQKVCDLLNDLQETTINNADLLEVLEYNTLTAKYELRAHYDYNQL